LFQFRFSFYFSCADSLSSSEKNRFAGFGRKKNEEAFLPRRIPPPQWYIDTGRHSSGCLCDILYSLSALEILLLTYVLLFTFIPRAVPSCEQWTPGTFRSAFV